MRQILLFVDMSEEHAVEAARQRGIVAELVDRKHGNTILRATMRDYECIVSWWLTGTLRWTRMG